MARKLRWGVISTADIGVAKVLPAMMKGPQTEILAISSRDQGRAQGWADRLGIPRAYGSYEAMLADPDIEAVYNPLPNHLHVDLSLKALAAGKHVLCEKPLGMDAKDAARLRGAVGDRVFAEAFMVRHHPQWHRLRKIVHSGELGEIRLVRVAFAYNNTDPNNVRNMADIGGGGIMDIGCYAVISGRYLFDAEPLRVVALVDRDPNFRTDRHASVIADFGQGRQLSFVCSTQSSPHQKVEAVGNKGRAEILIPFNPPAGQPTVVQVDAGLSLDGQFIRREIIPACDHYMLQGEAFADAVFGKAKLTWGLEDAIRNMAVLDAIFASEKSGDWEKVSPP